MREGSNGSNGSTSTPTLAMGDQAEGREDGFEVIARSVGACVSSRCLLVVSLTETECFSSSVFLFVARSRIQCDDE